MKPNPGQPGRARVQAFGRTDQGVQRDNNEDEIYFNAQQGLFLVIDGMGGQAAGERAAAEAKSILSQQLAEAVDSPEARLRKAIVI